MVRRITLAGLLRRGRSALALLGALALPGAAAALPTTDLWISEVMYNPTGSDDGREWVELFNAGAQVLDLSSWSLGWGDRDYSEGQLQLSGLVDPGGTFVVGGPTSDAGNGAPVLDLALDLDPGLGNPFLFSDGIALFDRPAAAVDASTIPVHSLVYGGWLGNLGGLMDETGAASSVDAGFAGAGSSLAFDGSGWSEAATPSPGTGPLVVPEAGSLALLGAGLALLGAGTALRRGRPQRAERP